MIEEEEKIKESNFETEKEKIKKMIHEGVLNVQKPYSYTFDYQGKLIIVSTQDFSAKKQMISVEGNFL